MARLLRIYQLGLVLLAGYLIAVPFIFINCGAAYYVRADVIALIAVNVVCAALLLWAGARDGDDRRMIGLIGSAALASVAARLLLPAAAVALVGVLRLPRGRRRIILATALAIVLVIAAQSVPLLAQNLMAPEQFICARPTTGQVFPKAVPTTMDG